MTSEWSVSSFIENQCMVFFSDFSMRLQRCKDLKLTEMLVGKNFVLNISDFLYEVVGAWNVIIDSNDFLEKKFEGAKRVRKLVFWVLWSLNFVLDLSDFNNFNYSWVEFMFFSCFKFVKLFLKITSPITKVDFLERLQFCNTFPVFRQ